MSKKIYPYRKVLMQIREEIEKNQWKPGERLPSESELVEKFKFSASTVKRALKILEAEGIIISKQGAGRFVASHKTKSKTWTIGIAFMDISHLAHPILNIRLEGIRDAISGTEYHLTMFALNNLNIDDTNRFSTEEQFIKLLKPESLDGLIVASQKYDASPVRLARMIPIVWMERLAMVEGTSAIRLDYVDGGFQAANHLLKLGHTKIALISMISQTNSGSEQADGMRMALKQNLKSTLATIEARNFSAEEGRRLALEILKMEPSDRPTALVCGSHELGEGAFEAFQEAGIDVPGNISLIIWNSSLMSHHPIEFTSVEMDFYQSGYQSVLKLIELINDRDTPSNTTIIPPKFIIGKSTKEI